MNKIVIAVTAGIILLTGVLYLEGKRVSKTIMSNYSSRVIIEKTWELPKVLREISGIAFFDENKIACVQDEKGKIFIYNLETSKIEKEISFSGQGDYEGIALKNSIAYVLRSDGVIFKIQDFQKDPKTEEFRTSLSRKQDVEGLYLDEEQNMLLLAIKGKDPESDDYKGIYRVNLNTMEMEEEPFIKIEYDHAIFEEVKEKKDHKIFRPSEINRNPGTGEFFMLEGVTPKLLLLDALGKPKELLFLDKKTFPQPEGLTFDPSGKIYISNEGKPATIHQVVLK